MKEITRLLWLEQDRHEGDRRRLFASVGKAVSVERVLYPGSFVDVAPSFVFPSVTYVDVDDRAARFFADGDGLRELILSEGGRSDAEVVFLHADYTGDLGLPKGSFDLLVSLYAGFVSEHCTDYLELGGSLLVAPSHGDAALASIDQRYALDAVIVSRAGYYRVSRDDLDSYLIPKTPTPVTRELIHERRRGIRYTRSPFAYLFRRVG